MSFYGQILYEFTKLFSRIDVLNNATNNVAEEPVTSEQGNLQAAEEWDTLNLKGGNRWINLTTNTTDKTVTISHSSPGTVDDNKSIISFEKVDSVPEDATSTQLKQLDVIKTTTSQYDNAGHVVSAITNYYTLPENPTAKSYDDVIDRLDIIEDKHLTIASTDDPIQFVHDDTNNGILITDYLSQKGYLNGDSVTDALTQYLTTYKYVTESTTGVTNDMYWNNIGTKNIAQTIGKINGGTSIQSAMNTVRGLSESDTDYNKIYTISEAIQALVAVMGNMKATSNANALSIEALTNRIDQLKAEVDLLKAAQASTE